MLKNVAIIWPRLDCSFKKGDVPEVEGPPNHPLRKYWEKFLQNLYSYHKNCGDIVTVHKKALWQFDLPAVKDLCSKYDIVYMPHKRKSNFAAGNNVIYYMQTVFPWMFTVDRMGWGTDMTWSPLKFNNVINEDLWKDLQRYKDSNQSKFPQPDKVEFKEKDYFVFMCQLPHDETIMYQSSVSVIEALRRTHHYAVELGKKLIVKGHPANPGSMEEMQRYCAQQNIPFTFDISIHDLFRNAAAAFMVNSGSGMEAMLHGIPIVTFGNSEYSNAVYQESFFSAGAWNIEKEPRAKSVTPVAEYLQTDRTTLLKTYKYFMTSFFEKCVDCNDLNSYKKVREIGKDCFNRRTN